LPIRIGFLHLPIRQLSVIYGSAIRETAEVMEVWESLGEPERDP
jgi:hypothetical protein